MAQQHSEGPFRGRLTPAQISEGMNAAEENAARLLADATTMLEAGRYPTAVALAILAIEESGKVAILRGLTVAKTKKDVKEAWGYYGEHRAKNWAWPVFGLILQGARHLDDFSDIADPESDHARWLDRVKQRALYSECLAGPRWSLPVGVIDEALAKRLILAASVLCRGTVHSTEEVKLWIKHMKPVWDTPWAKRALANYEKEMVERGLQPAPKHVDPEEFILGSGH